MVGLLSRWLCVDFGAEEQMSTALTFGIAILLSELLERKGNDLE